MGCIFETAWYGNTNQIGNWQQGAAENVIRALLANYDGTAAYQLTYVHAAYLRRFDTSDLVTRQLSYSTSDLTTLRALALVDFDTMALPYTTYTIDVADLSQQNSFEFLKLGSLVTVNDNELPISVQTNIAKITRTLSPAQTKLQVELSNRAKDLLDTIVTLLS
jgi:hypothetical protein